MNGVFLGGAVGQRDGLQNIGLASGFFGLPHGNFQTGDNVFID